MGIWTERRFRRRLSAVLAGGLLALTLALSQLSQPSPGLAKASNQAIAVFPLSRQPFYNELNQVRAQWRQHHLGEVAADSPRGTVVNFYAVMAEVIDRANAISRAGASEPGLWWSPQLQQQIEETETLFRLAVSTLDGSSIAQSVRADVTEEAALQLKGVLDFVFHTSIQPLNLPDAAALQSLGAQDKPLSHWRMPGTAITLTNKIAGDPDNTDFVFSSETVGRMRQMYADIESFRIPSDAFSTGDAYGSYARTPGGLVPPKWYLKLPASTRPLLNVAIGEQTLLQIALSVLVGLVGASGTAVLIVRFIKTYRFHPAGDDNALPSLNDDNLAWNRLLLLLPILPLARFSELIIDDYINITGLSLEIITSGYYVVYFGTASALSYLSLEAFGRSGAEWLVRLRGSRSPLMLQRMNNLMLPICRSLGALTALFLLYRLLVQLGLPSTTVLAFSAVPGLAIGLGASKLLGNLFAGLAIQTDRPLRVGEFCQVGENTGFITRIGLRSLELQTLESRITIPNSVADEATIVNYSRRSNALEAVPVQALDLRLQIEERLSPEQVGDLIEYCQAMLRADPDLDNPLVTINQTCSESLELIGFAMVTLNSWPAYLAVRGRVLQRLQQLIDQVRKSRIVVGVSYATSAEQLAALPGLIKALVNADPELQFRSCRLMTIGEFSYDYVFDFRSSHASYSSFKDSIDRLNRELLACFAAQGIEIPFPTSIELNQ